MKNRFIGLAAVYMLLPAMLLAQPDVANEIRPLGCQGRQGAPADVLRHHLEGGSSKRLPGSPGDTGFVGAGRRVHGTRAGRLFEGSSNRKLEALPALELI